MQSRFVFQVVVREGGATTRPGAGKRAQLWGSAGRSSECLTLRGPAAPCPRGGSGHGGGGGPTHSQPAWRWGSVSQSMSQVGSRVGGSATSMSAGASMCQGSDQGHRPGNKPSGGRGGGGGRGEQASQKGEGGQVGSVKSGQGRDIRPSVKSQSQVESQGGLSAESAWAAPLPRCRGVSSVSRFRSS